MSDIILNIEGRTYSGWTAITVAKSLDQLAGVFGLAVSNKMYDWKIRMGDECVVEIDGQKLITGYVEDMPIDYDAAQHVVNVSGRDVTGDLVDCCYEETTRQWNDQSIKYMVNALCKPFANVGVAVHSSASSLANFRVPGKFVIGIDETVFDAIGRLCRMKAILPVSYGDGYLTLTQAATGERTTDPIELGVNVKNARIDQSDRERFSRYTVKGQKAGEDDLDLKSIHANSFMAEDKVIKRYRPYIVAAETQADKKTCRERAYWEARVRAGKSRMLEYTIPGWTQSNGKVWPLNSLVRVKDSFLGIDKTMLIEQLAFILSGNEGTITRIGVTHKEAYQLIEEPITEITSPFDISADLLERFGKKALLERASKLIGGK